MRRVILSMLLCACVWLPDITLAAKAPASTPSFRQQIVQLHADDGHALAAVMTLPSSGLPTSGPVVIHCQGGPGATPLEGSGPWIAEGLAARGYPVIAPMIRHGDQLFSFDFAQLSLDVKAAVDFAQALGFTDIILAGSSFGSITITRYVVNTQDSRVRALLHFAPTADMGSFARRGMGDTEYFNSVATAGTLVSKGEGMSRLFAPTFNAPAPFPPGIKISFTHYPQVWLDLWGPASSGVNTMLFPMIKQPMLLLLGDQDGFNDAAMLAKLKQSATASERIDALFYEGGVNHSFYPRHADVIVDTVNWLHARGLQPTLPYTSQIMTIREGKMGEGMRRGFQYIPTPSTSPALVLMLHDWADDALHGASLTLGPLLASQGLRAIAINAVRGEAELLRAGWRQSDAAIQDWLDAQPKDQQVILLGHGTGAQRIAHYLANHQDRRIQRVALIDAKSMDQQWLQSILSAETFASVMQQAKGNETIHIDVPATARWPGGPSRLVMEPAAFNDFFSNNDNALSALLARTSLPVWQGSLAQASHDRAQALRRFFAQP